MAQKNTWNPLRIFMSSFGGILAAILTFILIVVALLFLGNIFQVCTGMGGILCVALAFPTALISSISVGIALGGILGKKQKINNASVIVILSSVITYLIYRALLMKLLLPSWEYGILFISLILLWSIIFDFFFNVWRISKVFRFVLLGILFIPLVIMHLMGGIEFPGYLKKVFVESIEKGNITLLIPPESEDFKIYSIGSINEHYSPDIFDLFSSIDKPYSPYVTEETSIAIYFFKKPNERPYDIYLRENRYTGTDDPIKDCDNLEDNRFENDPVCEIVGETTEGTTVYSKTSESYGTSWFVIKNEMIVFLSKNYLDEQILTQAKAFELFDSLQPADLNQLFEDLRKNNPRKYY